MVHEMPPGGDRPLRAYRAGQAADAIGATALLCFLSPAERPEPPANKSNYTTVSNTWPLSRIFFTPYSGNQPTEQSPRADSYKLCRFRKKRAE